MEQLDVSKDCYLNRETDQDDSEDSVEFLLEVRTPCLICGVDVEIDNIVKQEVVQLDEFTATGNTAESHSDVGGSNVDHDIFHWFLKWFGVEIVKKGKHKLIDRGWDGEGGDILRFCGNCKMELELVLELQKQFDELEMRIKNDLGEVKGKMERFEESFRVNGIYEKDQRYKRVRSWILKCEMKNLSCHTQNKDQSQAGPSGRRSSRLKTNDLMAPTITQTVIDTTDISMDSDPIVLLPSEYNTGVSPNSISDLPTASSEISSNNSVPAKISTIVVQKNASCKKADKTARKLGQKNVTTQKSMRIKKKAISEKVGSRKATTSSKLVRRPILNRRRNIKKVNYADDKSDDNEQNSSNSLAIKANGRKQEKVCNQTSARIAKQTLQKETRSRNSSKMKNKSTKTGLRKNMESTVKTKWGYKKDISKNTITFGRIKFSILTDPTGKVSCTSCKAIIMYAKESMRFHVAKHHTKKFRCPLCPYKGGSRGHLYRHNKNVHNGIKRVKFECLICGKLIDNRRNHEWTHTSKEEQEDVRKNEPARLPKWVNKNGIAKNG